MSGKLDQSLDDIVKTHRVSTRRHGRPVRRTAAAGKPVAKAPVGGVTKTARTNKPTGKTTVPTAPSGTGDSKIIVSGLPSDVTDVQIKDYFHKTIGPVRKVFLTYGPDGRSRGIATISFTKPDSAALAASQLNGVKVDNRTMKIEVIVSAAQIPAVVPKGLGDRVAQPKNAAKAKPKTASAVKAHTAATASARGRGGRRKNGRGKPKTAEELDAEMVDYFDATADTNGAAAGTAAANPAVATGGDTGMDDEIL